MHDDRIDQIIDKHHAEASSLIQVLLEIQRENHWLPKEALARVGQRLDVPLRRIQHIATFYKAFSLSPKGRHRVHICMGTACHIRGAGQLVEELERQLGVGPDETTEDFKFTVKTVNCVGACAMAPLVIVGEKYFGSAKPSRVAKYLSESAEGL